MNKGLSAVANGALGTWHLPFGLDLPDVQSSKTLEKYHQFLLEHGHSKSVALMRMGIVEIFKDACLITENKRLDTNISNDINFYDHNGRMTGECGPKNIFFPGSGIDRIRNFDGGIKDLNFYRKALLKRNILHDNAPNPEDFKNAKIEDVQTYLYQTNSESKTSSSWFKRLQDAYRLNIDPYYYSKEAEQFVEKIFMPYVSHN